ncbi:hypothetical protein BCEP27_11552 [Burkholderia cepacia]
MPKPVRPWLAWVADQGANAPGRHGVRATALHGVPGRARPARVRPVRIAPVSRARGRHSLHA